MRYWFLFLSAVLLSSFAGAQELTPSHFFGVHLDAHNGEPIYQYSERLDEAGLEWNRLIIAPFENGKNKQVYVLGGDASTFDSTFLKTTAQRVVALNQKVLGNIQPKLYLKNSTTGAFMEGDWEDLILDYSPATAAKWKKSVGIITRELKDYVKVWEIDNELGYIGDLISPKCDTRGFTANACSDQVADIYLKYYTDAYDAIKAECPDCTVYLAGNNQLSELQSILNKINATKLDGVAFHTWSDSPAGRDEYTPELVGNQPESFYTLLHYLRQLTDAKKSGVPILVTEHAFASISNNRFEEFAKYAIGAAHEYRENQVCFDGVCFLTEEAHANDFVRTVLLASTVPGVEGIINSYFPSDGPWDWQYWNRTGILSLSCSGNDGIFSAGSPPYNTPNFVIGPFESSNECADFLMGRNAFQDNGCKGTDAQCLTFLSNGGSGKTQFRGSQAYHQNTFEDMGITSKTELRKYYTAEFENSVTYAQLLKGSSYWNSLDQSARFCSRDVAFCRINDETWTDGEPKKVFYALKTLASQLNGYTFDSSNIPASAKDDPHLMPQSIWLKFKNGSQVKYVAWTIAATARGISIPRLAGKVLVEDLYGGSQTIANFSTISVTNNPVFLSAITVPEICTNGVDDDLDTKTDCADSDCGCVIESNIKFFLFKEIKTCFAGPACTSSKCFNIYNASNNAVVKSFEFSGVKSFPTIDPQLSNYPQDQKYCVSFKATDTEITNKETIIVSQIQSTVSNYSGGKFNLDPDVVIIDSADMALDLQEGFNGSAIVLKSAKPVVGSFIDPSVDFFYTLYSLKDPTLNVRVNSYGSGGATSADPNFYGMNGAGGAGSVMEYANKDIIVHEWLHALDFALEVNKKWVDNPAIVYNQCESDNGIDLSTYFPNADTCQTDPASKYCGGSCGDPNRYWQTLLINDHFPYSKFKPGSTLLIGNYCKDGVKNFDETAVDVGPSCLGTITPPASEICTNGIDDDSDGKVDCEDLDCPMPTTLACSNTTCQQKVCSPTSTPIPYQWTCQNKPNQPQITCATGNCPASSCSGNNLVTYVPSTVFSFCSNGSCPSLPVCTGQQVTTSCTTAASCNNQATPAVCLACSAGRANCDQNPLTSGTDLIPGSGCEINLKTDNSNCGICGRSVLPFVEYCNNGKPTSVIAGAENCSDGIDNEYSGFGDGKIDCADEECFGFIETDTTGKPFVCAGRDLDTTDSLVAPSKLVCQNNSQSLFSITPSGTFAIGLGGTVDTMIVTPNSSFDAICSGGTALGFVECNTDGIVENKSLAPVVTAGQTVTGSNSVQYVCAPVLVEGTTYESWVGCGSKIGPHGAFRAFGESLTINGNSYKCCSDNTWSSNGICAGDYASTCSIRVNDSFENETTTLEIGKTYQLAVTVNNTGNANWNPVWGGSSNESTNSQFLLGAGTGNEEGKEFLDQVSISAYTNRYPFGADESGNEEFTSTSTRTTLLTLVPKPTTSGSAVLSFTTLREWNNGVVVLPGWFGTSCSLPVTITPAPEEPGEGPETDSCSESERPTIEPYCQKVSCSPSTGFEWVIENDHEQSACSVNSISRTCQSGRCVREPVVVDSPSTNELCPLPSGKKSITRSASSNVDTISVDLTGLENPGISLFTSSNEPVGCSLNGSQGRCLLDSEKERFESSFKASVTCSNGQTDYFVTLKIPAPASNVPDMPLAFVFGIMVIVGMILIRFRR